MNQPTAHIAGWEHTSVQDEVIDKNGLPFTGELFAGGIPAVVDASATSYLAPTDIPLDSVSEHHGRSYEVGDAEHITAIWSDQYGNCYSSLSYKGNNFTAPGITPSLTAPLGYIPYGLQEDDALLRILKSSRILRENGIPTEWVVGVTEPAVIPYGEELVSQHEYKKKLLGEVLGKRSIEEAARIAKAIQPMTFFVTARCMEINDRPTDFLYDKTAEQIKARLQKIFTVYNSLHTKDTDFRPLCAESTDDCAYYFTYVLPSLQGKNLAHAHKIRLVHKFPVPGNVTALGGIIDLDSVHGEPLGIGDKPIDFHDIRRDIAQVYDENKDYTGAYIDIFRHVSRLLDCFNGNGGAALHQMRANFLRAYWRETGPSLSPEQACVLSLEASKDEDMLHLIGNIYSQVRKILRGHAELCDRAVAETSTLVENVRTYMTTFAKAHAERVVDVAHELGEVKKLDADEAAAEEFINSLSAQTMISIENEVVKTVVQQLTTEAKSEAFDSLLQLLGLTGEEDEKAKIALARAFLSPATIHAFSMRDRVTKHMRIFSRMVTKAVADAFNDEDEFRVLNLELNSEEAGNDGNEAQMPFYYQRLPYKIATAIPLDRLLTIVATEDGQEHIQVHYDSEESDNAPDEAIRSLPKSQYVTDASRVTVHREVLEILPEGSYQHSFKTSDDKTYLAALTVADKNGVVHLIIQKDP